MKNKKGGEKRMAMTKKELEKELEELQKEVQSLQSRLSKSVNQIEFAKKILS